MACDDCEPGRYCTLGTAEPIPCPAGTVGNATGLFTVGQCTPVAQGSWAPLGSNAPEACVNGFYCPGALQDVVFRGARPIIMPVGGTTDTREVEAISKVLTLDVPLDDFRDFEAQREALTLSLAARYSVDPKLLTLQLSAGSVQILVTIATTNGTSTPLNLDELEAAIAAVDNVALAASIGAVMNASLSVTSQLPQRGKVSVTVSARCNKGTWCTAGLVVDCPLGSYNPLESQTFATACLLCPANAWTRLKAATRREDCVCQEGYYNRNNGSLIVDKAGVLAMEVDCVLCPVGTDCSDKRGGATLAALPLQKGYYRPSTFSTDVRRCPDASEGCGFSDTAVCNATLSGCRGGAEVASQCAPSLMGAFCMQCVPADDGIRRFYLAAADSERPATCAACNSDGIVGRTLGVYSALLVVALLAVGASRVIMPRQTPPIGAAATSASRFWQAAKPLHKLKIVIGFCLLVTKVDEVYKVTPPQEVRVVMSNLALGVSLGLSRVSSVLTCLGVTGYHNRLVFWIILPIAACAALLLGCYLWAVARSGPRLATRGLMQRALPLILRLLFLVYPLVTSAAFEAFSCYEFDDGTSYLIADVAIECSTSQRESTSHLRVVRTAWVAIFLYPIGQILLTAALLYAARGALLSGQSTVLSEAITFLHRECVLHLRCLHQPALHARQAPLPPTTCHHLSVFRRYEPNFYWWEIVEMIRRLVLVGLFMLVRRGSVRQRVSIRARLPVRRFAC